MTHLLGACLLVQPLCVTPPLTYESGFFTVYNQAPTDGTIAYHQLQSLKLPLDLTEFAGVIAYVTDCSRVGQTAYLRLTDPQITIEYFNIWVPVMIFDCGGDADAINNFFVPNNIIGELGFYLASDSGAYDLGRGVAGDLSWLPPTTDCPATPTPAFVPPVGANCYNAGPDYLGGDGQYFIERVCDKEKINGNHRDTLDSTYID